MTDVPAGADDDMTRSLCGHVSRLVVTIEAPVEIVESVVRDELGRRRASARIQAFVPILTERAARRRLRDRPPS